MLEEYNTKITRFPDNTVEIIRYKDTRIRSSLDLEDIKTSGVDNSPEAKKKRMLQQTYRVKRKIRYYVLSNDFDKFWTLTFNDERVNSRDYAYARKRLGAWLKYQREKYGRFGYIFFPELHPSSGRIHFHGVTEGFDPPLTKARNAKTSRLIKKKGKQIYNADTWKNGFSTVSIIDKEDKAKTANYITKYITKDLIEMPNAYNQPKYHVSRGLKSPEVTYEMVNEKEFQEFTPSFVTGGISTETQEFEADVSIYNLNISEGQYSQSVYPETLYKLNLKKRPSTEKQPHLTVDDLTSK